MGGDINKEKQLVISLNQGGKLGRAISVCSWYGGFF